MNLQVHEYLGTMTFETNLGIESKELAFSLIIAPDADMDLLEFASKSLAEIIVRDTIDRTTSSQYHEN
jgi:hypothetical protein